MVKVYISLLVLACFVCNAQTQPGYTPLDSTFFARVAEAEASPAVSGYPFNLTNNTGAVAVYDPGTQFGTNGGTYTYLNDIGPFAYHITNASAASTWFSSVANGLNGYKTLSGIAANLRSVAFTSSQPAYVFGVFALTNDTNARILFDSHNSAARNAAVAGGITISAYAGSQQTVGENHSVTNKFIVWEWIFNGTSTTLKTNLVSQGLTVNAGAQNCRGLVLGANNAISSAATFGIAAFSIHTNISAAQELAIYQAYTNHFGVMQ